MDSSAFGAAEQFIEGTIAAALVALWLLAVGLHLARPYMLALTRKFTLRLGADLWWTIYVGMRDIFLLQVFLGSFIFFYPDVVKNNDLPITGGLAAVCAFGALMLKLMTRADADARSFYAQTILIGLGASLYLGGYLLGSQVTTVGSSISNQLASVLVTSQNQTVALALCYLSGFLVGIMGLVAVIYNLRIASPAPRGKADASAAGQPASQS
jgi:hypothetical protein